MPTTAKINRIIINTRIKFPNAPIALMIIFISIFNVGHDFASFNTRINLIETKLEQVELCYELPECSQYGEAIDIDK